MLRKQKITVIFTVIGTLIFTIGIIGYVWLDTLIQDIVFYSNVETVGYKGSQCNSTVDSEPPSRYEPAPSNTTNNPLQNQLKNFSNPANYSEPNTSASPTFSDHPASVDIQNTSPDNQNSNMKIVGAIQGKVNKPLEKTDVVKAGLIILRKLSTEEINFLFNFSNRKYTKEELQQVRAVLLTKLSDEEVATLRALGLKYGKQLRILDPNYPIK